MKKTKKAYEEYLNEFYEGAFMDYYSALKQFVYMTIKNRTGGTTTNQGIINAYNNSKLGTLFRKYDTIAFNAGFNDWKM